MSEINLSEISDTTLIDEINGRNNGLCVWTEKAREEAVSVINALAGCDPDKLDALVEAARYVRDQLEGRFATIHDADPRGDLIKAYVDLKAALAAFEGDGGEDEEGRNKC